LLRFGGTYSVLQPGISRQLRERKVANLEAGRPEMLLSANVGCIGTCRPAPTRRCATGSSGSTTRSPGEAGATGGKLLGNNILQCPQEKSHERKRNLERLAADVKVVIGDAEELLRQSAAATGDQAAQLRERAMALLRQVRERAHDAQEKALAKAGPPPR